MILWLSSFNRVYRALRPVYLFLGLFFFFAVPGAAEEKDAHYRQEAIRLELAGERSWQVLLHYRPHGRGWESLVDDSRFFLHPQGKIDPRAELDASLEALFASPEKADGHFRCRFPARSEWLVGRLAITEKDLPQPLCTELEQALAAVDPRSAVLVFPAAHNNGPASMFGHTLLRIGSSHQSELLSHAINYAAQTDETNGFVYAYKGLFGLYPGTFSILPYYEKLNEYSEMEHRDVWEYKLNLSPAEVRRLILHTWELREVASDYFFFDENCSFMLLFLLQAARPELRLAEIYWERPYSFWVIPADTVGAVRKADLVDGIRYRPAQATRVRYRASLLSPPSRRAAYEIAMERTSAADLSPELPPQQRRQVLDLAAEYLRYRYSRRDLSEETFRSRFIAALAERSRLGAGEPVLENLPRPTTPEEGHAAGRWTVGGGVRDDRFFLELSWRPAYHDLLDPDEGFTRGAQINFFSLKGRYFPAREQLRLEEFHLVDILSLAQRDLFFHPVSWKVLVGVDRKPRREEDLPFVRVRTGAGLAWSVGGADFVYLMADADLNLSDRFEGKAAPGAGISGGTVLEISPDWKAHLSASALFYALEEHEDFRVALDQSFRLSRAWGITVHGAWERAFDESRSEASAVLNRYF